MGPAASQHRPSDCRPAIEARFAGPHIDPVLHLKQSPLPGRVHVIRNRGAPGADCGFQHSPNCSVEPVQLGVAQPTRYPRRPDTCPKEALVSIDIPDPVQQSLVQERRLDGELPPAEQSRKVTL